MKLKTAINQAKNCYEAIGNTLCPGDAGNVECFFCKGCVLSLDERIDNLKELIQK